MQLHIKTVKMSKKFVRIYLKESTVLLLNEKLNKEERLKVINSTKGDDKNSTLQSYGIK